MIISTNQKYATLVDALFSKTANREISWIETSIGGVFSTSVGEYTIHIEEPDDSYNNPDAVTITMLTKDGERVDVFGDSDLVIYSPKVSGFTSYRALLRDLYKRSNRDASGAEKVLDSILDALGAAAAVATKDEDSDLNSEIPF